MLFSHRIWRAPAVGVLLLAAAAGLSAADAASPRWSLTGGHAVEAGLAGPAGGPVAEVAFSLDGRTLVARTDGGRRWISADDGESWAPLDPSADAQLLRVPEIVGVPGPRPEPDARLAAHPFRAGRYYALGRSLWVSPDGGALWIRLSGEGEESLIGERQSSIAFDPTDPELIYISNSAGLWRSADGGASWTGLNERLPNFPAARFLPLSGTDAVELEAAGIGRLLLARGEAGEHWQRINALGGAFGRAAAPTEPPLGGVSAGRFLASASPESGGGYAYAAGADGRLWVSSDSGLSWRLPRDTPGPESGRRVTALWADSANPRAAVVAFSGPTGARLYRTWNGGALWQEFSAGLPSGEVHALAASLDAGAIYVAGDAGVFYASADFEQPGPEPVWREASGNLPAAPIRDLLLNSETGRLFALVDGYGVYRVRAPAVSDALRLLNAADLSRRPAAPGGLLTVRGGTVGSVEITGLPAPILSRGERESQIQVPFEASGKELAVRLSTASGGITLSFPFDAVSPAIFVDASGPLVLDAGSGRLLDLAHPARPGGRILILATGLGRVRPPWPTGVPAPVENPPETIAEVGARSNGVPLEVVSSTLAGGYIGAYLVEAKLPRSLTAGVVELVLESGGRTSNAVRIFVDPER